ncbi:MAG TPA: flagellar assembly protein H, partial [Thermoanaerobaculia bacterium]|nr:flagellar assembly protein H [Thermoanaerobaculia bacterium]
MQLLDDLFPRPPSTESASLLRAGEATFLDKEDFTDWPAGDRREMDLVAKVPVARKERPLLVHVEIETDFRFD